MADLGEGPAPLFWVKKEEITEGQGRASKTPLPTPLAQGLDPPVELLTPSTQQIE